MDTQLQIVFFVFAFAAGTVKMVKYRRGVLKAYKQGELFYPIICAGLSLAFILLFLCCGLFGHKYNVFISLSLSAVMVGEIVYVSHLVKDIYNGNRLAWLFLYANIMLIYQVFSSCLHCGDDFFKGIHTSSCEGKIIIGLMYVFFHTYDSVVKKGEASIRRKQPVQRKATPKKRP